jgi:rubrerythrin
MNEDSSVNKNNVLSLALSLATLALAVSPVAVAHTSRMPNGQERHRAETGARRPAKGRKSAQAQVITYTCPMHHDVHLKSPGECPICGMELDAEKPGKAKSE